MPIEHGNILTDGGVFKKGSIEFGETIEKVETCEGEEPGSYIIPGLIDIHSHGVVGYDFSEATPEDMREMSLFYARNGITSFLATTITAPEEQIALAVKNIAAFERP